jgi:Flp pilus assembly pilin Flp
MLKTLIARLRRDERGASMVEYAVALLVVTAAGVGLMSTLGTETGYNVDDACGVLKGDTAIAATGTDC